MPRLPARRTYGNASEVLKSVGQLDGEMRRASPNPDSVACTARQAAEQMDRLLHQFGSVQLEARSLAKVYGRDWEERDRAASNVNWDAAGQLYLALAALTHAKPHRDVNPV